MASTLDSESKGDGSIPSTPVCSHRSMDRPENYEFSNECSNHSGDICCGSELVRKRFAKPLFRKELQVRALSTAYILAARRIVQQTSNLLVMSSNLIEDILGH